MNPEHNRLQCWSLVCGVWQVGCVDVDVKAVLRAIIDIRDSIDLSANSAKLQSRDISSVVVNRRVCEALRVCAILDTQEAEAQSITVASVNCTARRDLCLVLAAGVGAVNAGHWGCLCAKCWQGHSTRDTDDLSIRCDGLTLPMSSRASDVVKLLVWLERRAMRWAVRRTPRTALRRSPMRGVYRRWVATLCLPGTPLSWLACGASLVRQVGKEVVT
jgi:hypothetical protein